MNRRVIRSTVGNDGMLHLSLPVEVAGQDVCVTVEKERQSMTQEQWRTWVESMAGSITDQDFERPSQLPVEERDPL